MTDFTTFLILCVSTAALAVPEKVLFGQPTVPEKQELNQNSSRKSRVFSFPSSQQDSRTRTSYVLASPSASGTYDLPGSEYEVSGQQNDLQDESRLLSLLPTFGDNGMQVGLDFKLPFFSIPYSKIFSGLSAPIIGGSSFFGGSNSYGNGGSASTLSSSFFGSENALSSSMATVAAMAVTAALLYPKITGIFSPSDGKTVFRNANSADEFVQNLNSVLNQFNIDGEACMKMALCSVASAKRRYHTEGRGAKAGTTSAADLVEDVLNLPVVKKSLGSATLVQARDFGGSGGDCDYFNRDKKCPFSSGTVQKMLMSFG